MTELEVTPALDWLKSGTLDDTAWLQPEVGIWGHDGQPWVTLPESVARFDRNPPAA